jgi:Ran GTPase-activating protein (RanGAP) involved in mRNA processing and transport
LILDLGKNHVGDKGALALAEALKSNTVLRDLNLQSNSIRREGATALATALDQNIAISVR